MKFRPLHDRVVVKRLEEEQKTKGGIIIPDTAAEKPQTGKVVAAGPGARGEDGKLSRHCVQGGAAADATVQHPANAEHEEDRHEAR